MEFVPAADRSSVRRHVRVHCEVVRERDFRRIADRVLDLSQNGMRVPLRVPVMTGEKVVLTFRTPDGKTFIDGEGYVARVSHGRRPGDFGPSVGIRFEVSDPAQRATLKKQLLRMPPTLPKRVHRVDYAATVRKISGL